MSENIERVVLESLIGNEEYARHVMPYIKDDYFEDRIDRVLFGEINRFFTEHNKLPTKKVLSLFIDDYREFKQEEHDMAHEAINAFDAPDPNTEWLLQRTEKWAKEKAVFNAIMTSIGIMDGRNKELNPEAIPSLLQEALGVCFNKSVGHDFFADASARYDAYHLKEDRMPFDLDMFNRITKGGLPKKTLTAAIAGTGVGKSIFMCHCAAASLKQGKNVLYITLEMSEERIAERVDCNLLNVNTNELAKMSKKEYLDRMSSLENKTNGKFIVKEYPTASAHVGHFRVLLEELKSKQNFIPDMVCIDYINICASQRYKAGSNYSSYFAIKAIAEEIRSLAVEYDVAILSATQSTRNAQSASDVEISDTSESMGLPHTLDLMFAIIRTEELDQMGQLMIKQLKNRFNDTNYYKKFVLGIDIAKFKLYDVDNNPNDLVDAGTYDKPSGSGSTGAVDKKNWDWTSDVDFN